MTINLFIQAITKYIFGVLVIGLLIFLPAGTISFFNGWLFMGLLFIPMFFAGIVLMVKNPELLKKRLNAKEKLDEQRTVIKLSGLMFAAGFVVAGLGFRMHWFILPTSFTAVASIVFLVSYGLYAEVLRENTYLSRTIEVQENQKVIDAGLYGIVRHPMYSATLLFVFIDASRVGLSICFYYFLCISVYYCKTNPE